MMIQDLIVCYNITTAERLSRLTYDVVREARRSSHPEIASATATTGHEILCRVKCGGFLWYNKT